MSSVIAPATDGQASEAFWRSLLYFNVYRVVVSGFFFAAGNWWPDLRPLGMQYGGTSGWVVQAYLLVSIAFVVIQTNWHPRFNLLLTCEVVIDIAVFTSLMHLSGGIQSGFSYMILVVLAGASLVSHGRLTLFFASIASMSVLSEHVYSMIQERADISSLTFAGIICAGFFGTAVLAHLLSKRVVASEALAKARGDQLVSQVKINAQVIHDMLDGLLVVNASGQVLQSNPSATRLVGSPIPSGGHLGEISKAIEEAYFSWRHKVSNDQFRIFNSAANEVFRLRFVETGSDDNALIYLEDAARLRAEAQQIKLAALGRLTANMAHEIRNPLASISHAAELMGEENQRDVSVRLSHIITENTARLNRIVSDVLELGRRDRVQAESIDLSQFMVALKDEVLIWHPDSPGCLVVLCAPGYSIQFDRSHLHRILTNLISNSLRYASGKEGSVSLWVEEVPALSELSIHIEDDGPGIPQGDQGRIFEPFFTTHSQGTGLGLYIARELCNANHASLELVPSEAGAHFKIAVKLG